MGFKRYVIRRAIDSIILLIITVIFNFILFRVMPGDPTTAILGRSGSPVHDPGEYRSRLIERFGLDKAILPFIDKDFQLTLDPNTLVDNQFVVYIQKLLVGDLGISFNYFPQEVSYLIFGHRLLNTIILMGLSIVLSFLLAILLGTLASSKFKSKTDMTLIFVTLTSYSTPVFWIGMLIVFIFFGIFGILPYGGSPRIEEYPDLISWGFDYLYHMIGPLVTLTVSFVGAWFLIARDQMLGVFTEDYITTARAKGLPERRVMFVHARKNAMLPMISVLALAMTYLVSGATMTETVFNWNGLGLLTFESVYRQDYPVLQGLLLLVAAVAIVSNFIADLIYGLLDPRIRY
ncbi:MAG: ABC transporter permease [Candidatus Hodarchaeota archaeon]